MKPDRRQISAVALLALLAACELPAEPGTEAGTAATPAPTRAATCEREAVLLARPLTLRSAPDPDAPVAVTLPTGRPIYRCELSGSYLGIMFPEPGAAADCSTRPEGRACPTGWAEEPPAIGLAG